MDQVITRAPGATPSTMLPRAAEPRSWSILLTSENHGTVGPAGSTFPHAGEKHERVHVMEIVEAGEAPAPGTDLGGLVRITLDGTVIPLATSFAPAGASTVLTDERVDLRNLALTGKQIEGGVEDQLWVTLEDAVAAQAGQVAATEELARFCPACGSVGDIGPEYRDCCPDGNEARRIPKSLAEKCHELFNAALSAMLAAAPAAPAQAKPLPEWRGIKAVLTNLIAVASIRIVGKDEDDDQLIADADEAVRQLDAEFAQASTSGERQEGGL